MACIDMFNTDHHQGLCTPMSPRISFSNDFADSQPTAKHDHTSPLVPMGVASEHFEFSVSKYTMMPADELFSKGTMLPFKKKTLRDELLVDPDEEDVMVRPPKVPTKWKEFLGLKKSHIVNKKGEGSNEYSMDNKISQAHLGDRDVEMRI